jgi:hypothetical protein
VLNGWRDQFWTRRHRNDLLRLLRSSGVRPNNSTRDQIRALLRGLEGLGTPTLHHAAHTRTQRTSNVSAGIGVQHRSDGPWMPRDTLGPGRLDRCPSDELLCLGSLEQSSPGPTISCLDNRDQIIEARVTMYPNFWDLSSRVPFWVALTYFRANDGSKFRVPARAL